MAYDSDCSPEKSTKISVFMEDNDDDEVDNNNHFAMPKKCNKSTSKQKHKKTNTTINPYLVLGAEF